MESTVAIKTYLELVSNLDLFHSRGNRIFSQAGNLLFYLDYLFGDIDFRGKAMLDIGAGAGIFSCYGSLRGASSVVALEPGGDGSRPSVIREFRSLKEGLGLSNVQLEECRFQEFDAGTQRFDILLMNNSINHLDEEACINLQDSQRAKDKYEEIFEKIGNLVRPGGVLIAADCSRYNFFTALKIENPFNPGIEWYKHQSPEFWSKMLEDVGFSLMNTRWGCFKQLRKPGRWLLGNRWMAYFLQSHFCLTMTKNGDRHLGI